MHPIPTTSFTPGSPGILSLVAFGALVLILVAVLMAVATFVGQRKKSTEKSRPYESGIIPTGSARLQSPVPFYLVAIFFLIFDVEGAFIFSWAIAFEDLGWAGWLQICFFIMVLLLGLAYIWRKKGLDWGAADGKK
jgi:NADH-quinone oxidoreductase subunit A